MTAELVGLGRLQTLLVDDTIEEVHILGCDQVRITRHGGGVDWAEPIADSDDELVEILQAAARRAGATERSLSTSKPTLDLQLPDGSRLAAVFLVSHRPYAVIRKHNTLDVSLDDIAGGRADLDEMIDPLLRDFLRASMRAGLNIMVAGLAGAGKTTVIRALMDEIPADEPYVLLEESRELLPARRGHKHRAVMSFESREGHGERGSDGRPAGEVSIADLIPLSLRMGVLRIIVGEVRSREIVPMLQAMTTSRGLDVHHPRPYPGRGERPDHRAGAVARPGDDRRPGPPDGRQRPRPDRLRHRRGRDRDRRPQAPVRLARRGGDRRRRGQPDHHHHRLRARAGRPGGAPAPARAGPRPAAAGRLRRPAADPVHRGRARAPGGVPGTPDSARR